ncbi:DUF5722 domain-containing protein [Parafilimonas sp.]|uniref:DUF5722 domain-containing protein n=1 Tax=Parafilimonas sp. TaxID=1969739 RepID=UPI003F8215DD
MHSNFSNKITNVTVNKNTINIEGKITDNSENFYLGEWRMFDETKLVENTFTFITPLNSKHKTFSIQVKRFTTVNDTGYDRLYSRWVIVSKKGSNYQLQSFAHYANDINEIAKQYLPEEKSSNKKGLAGYALAPNNKQDILDLNIGQVTVNAILPNFLTFKSAGYAYSFNGHTYYFNPTYVNNFDATIKFCTDNNIFVTALVLIPRNLPEKIKPYFVYPNSNEGVHSMANITSVTGMNFYAAIVGFLAERYSRPDKKYGRITNWVIHNEVDNGYYWTNAGQAEMPAYTELYDRSMRTAYYTIRQYNPAGKVLICFTHFWAKPADAKSYAPKDMLDMINLLSKEQGDYEWGIAYHPYPQSLRGPKTWLDKDAGLNIHNTSFITPKNIELIDTWVRTASHLYNGLKLRTLMFTEQGIHSNSYNKDDLIIQAAGVAYMWKKINRLPSLEAFDYHGLVDNIHENGLKVGLWTVKSGTNDTPDEKKPAWYVYQKAGTKEEDSTFAFAFPVIGINNWQQAFNKLSNDAMPCIVTFKVIKNGNLINNASIYFNEEMHKTINGIAIFYDVAAIGVKRNYLIKINDKIVFSSNNISIMKNQVITVNIQ